MSAGKVVAVNVCTTPPTVKMVCTGVLNNGEVVSLTTTCWPLLILPGALVKLAPSIEYSPSVMLIGAALLMSLMAMLLELTSALRANEVWAIKLKAAGVVSSARVVSVNIVATPPMVSVTLTEVVNCVAEVPLTITVWPFDMVPSRDVKSSPSIEYSPLLMLMAVAVLMPVTVMAGAFNSLLRARFFCSVNVMGSGVVSNSSWVAAPQAASVNNKTDNKLDLITAPTPVIVGKLSNFKWGSMD